MTLRRQRSERPDTLVEIYRIRRLVKLTKPVKPAKRRLYSLNGMPADPERTATWAVDGAIALSLEREPISVEASRDVS